MTIAEQLDARAAKRAARNARNPLTAYALELLARVVASGEHGYRVVGTSDSLSINNLAKRGFVMQHVNASERGEFFVATASGRGVR